MYTEQDAIEQQRWAHAYAAAARAFRDRMDSCTYPIDVAYWRAAALRAQQTATVYGQVARQLLGSEEEGED